MKLVTFLIISISLAVGVLGAATAYSPSLGMDDEKLLGAALASPAGVVVVDDPAMLEEAQRLRIGLATGEVSQAELDDWLAGIDDPHDRRVYEVLTGLPAASIEHLTLNADGVVYGPSMQRLPLYPPTLPNGEPRVITPENLEVLRLNADRIRGNRENAYVRVKEFSFERWRHWWWFVLAAVGLLIGAFLVRMQAKQAIAAAARRAASAEGLSPAEALRKAHDEVAQLHRDLPDIEGEKAKIDAIVHRIDDIQRDYLEPFLDGRAQLVADLGMTGYAQLMDRFAAAERQLNRAWSAAADHVLAEAEDCLDLAVHPMDETTEKLKPSS